jgi:hypothetical protein
MPRLTPSGTDQRPVVDGKVLLDSPRQLLAAGSTKVKTRSIMAGVVTEEWTRHIGLFIDDMFASKPHLGLSVHCS